MPGYLCPKGHDSADNDFCSVCGAKIPGPKTGNAGPAANPPSNCLDCGTLRGSSGGIFCELCGFNFQTGAHGDPNHAALSGAPDAPSGAPAAAEWEAVITIDPSLRDDGSPEPPAGIQPVVVRLAKDTNLLGRRSEKRGILPEISLDRDDAVSHRHALLNRMSDGSLTLRDIGSSNGTRLNGAELPPLTDTPVRDGDQITLGHWTRIVLKALP